MIDPISIGLILGGTALDIYGQHQQARSQRDQLIYQAKHHRQQAMLLAVRGRLQERKLKKESEQLLGRMRASFGGSGVQMASGTPLMQMMNSAKEAAFDQYWLRKETELQVQEANAAAISASKTAQDVDAAFAINALSSILGAGVKMGSTGAFQAAPKQQWATAGFSGSASYGYGHDSLH